MPEVSSLFCRMFRAAIVLIMWLSLLLLLVVQPTEAALANIRYSPQAKQQIQNWANGGGGAWTHSIQRGGLGVLAPRRR